MRLKEVRLVKAERSNASQPLYPAPERELQYQPAIEFHKSWKQRLRAELAGWPLPWVQKSNRQNLGSGICEWAETIAIDGRFSGRRAWRYLLQAAGDLREKHVLLPGSHFNCHEVRDWLKLAVDRVTMLDITDWGPSLRTAAAALRRDYRPDLQFIHGTLDRIPLADSSVDIVETRAVLEHAGNMKSAAQEMARVLRPEGVALHGFGPLYFSAGGDHCIGAYGDSHVYDHILLDEKEYQARLRDEQYFERQGKVASDSRYWAIQNIFSFLLPREYLEIFSGTLRILRQDAIVSGPGLRFRKEHPDAWEAMIKGGLDEESLLVTGLTVLMKKDHTSNASMPAATP